MSTLNRFVFHEFEIEVNDNAYLVEVGPHSSKNTASTDFNQVPYWVFHSRHAIWLVRKNLPLVDRALEGERIKKEIIRRNSVPDFQEEKTFTPPGATKMVSMLLGTQ